MPPGRSSPRVAVASLTFEGNSFSPVLSGLDQFRRCYLHEGEALVHALAPTRDAVAGGLAALAGATVLPLIAADAGAGGRVADPAYAELKSSLLRRLHEAAPVDGVFLALHGATITESLDDAEGDLLEAVRAAIGPAVPIAVSLDLHGHVTPAMVRLADIVLGCKLYPHDDAFETGARACELLLAAIAGHIRPQTSLRKLAALFPVPGQLTADPFPMAALRHAAVHLESEPGILAASYFPVQPWLDLPDAGFAATIVTDAAPEAGHAAATRLCELAWDRRHAIATPVLSPEAAIHAHHHTQGTVLLADVADCVGGGAPGTSAEVIAALLAHAPEAASAAVIAAPAAVRAARRAGPGATATITLGEPGYGPLVTREATVEHLFDGSFTYAAGPLGGVSGSLGPSAVLRIGALRVLATTHPAYEYGDEQFAAAGMNVRACRFVAVKNPVNARFAIPNAAFVVLDTAGPTSPRLAALPWRRLARPCFPITDSDTPIWRADPRPAQPKEPA